MKNKTQCFLVVTQHSQNFAQTSSMAVCVFTSQSYVLPNTDLLAYGTFLRIVSQYWFLQNVTKNPMITILLFFLHVF